MTLEKTLNEIFENRTLVKMIAGNRRKKSLEYTKVTLKPIFIKNEYRAGYIIAYSDLLKILHTDKIFQYLTTPFIPTSEEWRQLNAGIIYTRRGTHEEQTEVRELETLSASFNLLLNLYVVENLPVADKLIDIAIVHNAKVRKQLTNIYS